MSTGVRKVSTKNWVKKFKTLTKELELLAVTTNPKHVTGGHFQDKLSPLFSNIEKNPLAIFVLKPEYENITLALTHM